MILALVIPEIWLGFQKFKIGHAIMTTTFVDGLSSLAGTFYDWPMCQIWSLYLYQLRR